MLLIDSLLMGGIRFVLDKVARAVESELYDEDKIREELLAAQLRLELGEIDEAEFAETERDVLARLREVRAQKRGEGPDASPALGYAVTGVEATFTGDEHADEPRAQGPVAPVAATTKRARAPRRTSEAHAARTTPRARKSREGAPGSRAGADGSSDASARKRPPSKRA